MRRILLLSTAFILGISASAQAEDHAQDHNHGKPQWGYTGAVAAPYWGTLHESYDACVKGQAQSPINIAQYLQEDLPGIQAAYVESGLEVVNNGHTIQVNFDEGSSFTSGGQTFNLLQLHFHTPSEHYLDGAPYPMEAHFVHQTENGTLGVVGVMMKLGAHNPVIEGIWQNAPIVAGETKSVDSVKINAGDMMPSDLSYYHYGGSLTTPPCTEGVEWHVLKQPIEISEIQLKAFQALFPVNARPVQPLNDRAVSGN